MNKEDVEKEIDLDILQRLAGKKGFEARYLKDVLRTKDSVSFKDAKSVCLRATDETTKTKHYAVKIFFNVNHAIKFLSSV